MLRNLTTLNVGPKRSVPQTARKAMASLQRRAAVAVAATMEVWTALRQAASVLLADLWCMFLYIKFCLNQKPRKKIKCLDIPGYFERFFLYIFAFQEENQKIPLDTFNT